MADKQVYRPRILHPLGFDGDKPIPAPKAKLPDIPDIKGNSNVETGVSRFMKNLKPFTPNKIKE